MVLLKALSEQRNQRLTSMIQNWTTALDTIDFISLLGYSKRYSDARFVFITLSIWSVSCLVFSVPISLIKTFLIKKYHPTLAALLSGSLLSVLTMRIFHM
jgi:hypothetical protein